MNHYLKTWRVILLCSCMGIFAVIIVVKYARLAFIKEAPGFASTPIVERGSIVDRSGFPLAVQTNFYRIGVSTKDIKNTQLFSKNMAPVLGLSEEELFNKIDRRRDYVILKKKQFYKCDRRWMNC